MSITKMVRRMSRAERRRLGKEKGKVATYNLTETQLQLMVDERIRDRMAQVKKEATEDAVRTSMVLMLTLPLEVLIDHYWQKSYSDKIPKFTEYVIDYYKKWENGELDMDKLREDLWERGRVRIEEREE